LKSLTAILLLPSQAILALILCWVPLVASAADPRVIAYQHGDKLSELLRATDLLSRIWPGLAVLGFFLAARMRLRRKLLFVIIGIVIAYASQYLALWIFALAMNAAMMRFPDQMLNAVVWSFGLAFLVSLLAPTLGAWAFYRFWIRKDRLGAAA
jgi:hypothetical protein